MRRSRSRSCSRNSRFSCITCSRPGERCRSYFHQSRPISSALSIEQIIRRIRIVSSSTSASETLMSPATTRPLSRTRSRMSTSPVLRLPERSVGMRQRFRAQVSVGHAAGPCGARQSEARANRRSIDREDRDHQRATEIAEINQPSQRQTYGRASRHSGPPATLRQSMSHANTPTPRVWFARVLTATALAIAVLTSAAAAIEQPDQEDLKRLSIEQLMLIDVTTAGRRAEPVGTTPAAVSVISGEDIRRAGVTTIADAVQLADGVHVARFNNGTWAISPRGFNSNTANKLLVMVDGRTVYSPLFTGVFWNVLDYVLEDIDRIEVIRGPGAALWGANAVNGVINIITRHSRDTQGTLVSASSGNEDRFLTELRYGAAAGPVTWRAYGKFADRDAARLAGGSDSGDPRRHGQAGFRVDGGDANGARWLVKGDAFHSRDTFPDRPAGEFTDLNLQGRWSAPLAPASRFDVQSYYRREYRRVPRQLTHRIDVFDIEAQHAATMARRHAVVWGGGLRVNRDRTEGTRVLAFDPVGRTYPVANIF